MRSSAIFYLLVVAHLTACDGVRPLPPQRQATKNPARVPAPPPPPPAPPEPRTQFEHPLYRFPRTPSPNEPVRDPAVRPRLLKSVPPEYTAEARKARIQGIVILELIVEPDGRISGGKVLKPLPAGLAQKAIDAVKEWRYSPGKNGQGAPVRCVLNVTVRFTLP